MSDFLQAIADHLNGEPTMCRCGHPSVLHADRVGCTARWEHDSGSDVCPCEVSKYRPAGPDPRLEGATEAPPCSVAPPDESDICSCGHRKDDHERYVGCLYPMNWRTASEAFCPCDREHDRAEARAAGTDGDA